MKQKITDSTFKWFLLSFFAGAGLTFAIGIYAQFHAVSNDYWNILYYGRRMSLAQPQSLYNGFFPFGYALLVGQMPFTYVLPLSYALNALLAGLFSASVSALVSSTRSVVAALAALFAALAAPFIFESANTLSPDIGSAAFTAFAIFLLWRRDLGESRQQPTVFESALAGASLGLAFLWRSHAVVSSAAIVAGYFIFAGIRPLRSRLWLAGTFVAFASLQALVNLISGHGVLETAQAYNMYKFFYGVDPTYPPAPAVIENFSLVEYVTAYPRQAFDAYLPWLLYLLSLGWAAALGFLLSLQRQGTRFFLFLLFFFLAYSVPVAVGGSPRSPVILMAAYIPSIALLPAVLADLAGRVFKPAKWMAGLAGVLFFAAFANLFYGWVIDDVNFVKRSRTERRALSTIEQVLISSGLESPTEVFADRYDFYTPNTMPYRSRQIGLWSLDWVWGFKDEFPPLPNDSWDSFSAACRRQGIRFLVLSPNSRYRGEFFPLIYNDETDIEGMGLQFIAQRGNIRVYRFK